MADPRHHERDRALAFGRVAELYDAVRPAYPDAAVDGAGGTITLRYRTKVTLGRTPA